jgi:nitrate reductase NapE component
MNNYQMMQPTPARPPQSRKRHKVEEEEEEGMNILAVIIFGSLSVTALGGLGMLILLMFTTG